MKLTAQFVARNGAMFLDKLMMREQRNYQFDFLRKQHPLFSYFTKLVEQYSRVMLPPKDLQYRLRDDVERPVAVSNEPVPSSYTCTCRCITDMLLIGKGSLRV